MQNKESSSSPHSLPSKAWYLLALAAFILGLTLSIYYLYKAFTQPTHVIEITPNTTNIHVASPGKYTLWIIRSRKSQTAEQLKVVQQTPAIVDQSRIVFKETSTGKSTAITVSKGWHFKTKDQIRFSLGDIYFARPGVYNIAIANPPHETYVLYLHKPNIGQIVKYLILSVVSFIVGLVACTLISLIVFIQRTNLLGTQPIDPQTLKDQPAVGTAWAMAIHLSGLAGLLFPFGNIIVPLFLWAVKRHESPFLDFHGKEAVNFQISVSVYYLICIILSVIIIGLLLMPLLAAFHIIAMIIASVSASHGNLFRYPLSIRFIK